jgi:effector-binding domain-containing protein
MSSLAGQKRYQRGLTERHRPGTGRVEIGELPAVEVAVVRTRDEDEAAEEGYATLKNWLAEQGHVLRGAKREVPLEGSGELEVQFPFRLLT